MSRTFPCERVDLDFLRTAPNRFSNSVDLAITPEQLFEVLADAESWPHWAAVITKVAWTSPEPRGVGATRVVDMRGGIVGTRSSWPGSRAATWLFASTRARRRRWPHLPRTTVSSRPRTGVA